MGATGASDGAGPWRMMMDKCPKCKEPHTENIVKGIGVDREEAKRYGCGSTIWQNGKIDQSGSCAKLAARKERLAVAEGLLEKVKLISLSHEWPNCGKPYWLCELCGESTESGEGIGHLKHFNCPIPDIEAYLAHADTGYVAVRREDLKLVDYLFCRKSLPLVGADREAGERLKAALERKENV